MLCPLRPITFAATQHRPIRTQHQPIITQNQPIKTQYQPIITKQQKIKNQNEPFNNPESTNNNPNSTNKATINNNPASANQSSSLQCDSVLKLGFAARTITNPSKLSSIALLNTNQSHLALHNDLEPFRAQLYRAPVSPLTRLSTLRELTLTALTQCRC